MIEAVCYASRPSDASPIAVVVLTDQLHFTGLPATMSPASTSYSPSPRCSSPVHRLFMTHLFMTHLFINCS